MERAFFSPDVEAALQEELNKCGAEEGLASALGRIGSVGLQLHRPSAEVQHPSGHAAAASELEATLESVAEVSRNSRGMDQLKAPWDKAQAQGEVVKEAAAISHAFTTAPFGVGVVRLSLADAAEAERATALAMQELAVQRAVHDANHVAEAKAAEAKAEAASKLHAEKEAALEAADEATTLMQAQREAALEAATVEASKLQAEKKKALEAAAEVVSKLKAGKEAAEAAAAEAMGRLQAEKEAALEAAVVASRLQAEKEVSTM